MRVGLKVVLLLTIAVALAGCGSSPQPEDALVEFARHWQEQNPQAMYQLLSQESKAENDLDSFTKRITNISQGVGLKSLEVKDLSRVERNQTATLTYTIVFKTATVESFQQEYSLEMVKEGKDWRLNWGHQHIFPQLREEHRIRVNRFFPERGQILDRHGNILAAQGAIREVGLVPGRITDQSESLSALAPLVGLSPGVLEALLNQGWVRADTFVPVKKITEDQWQLQREELLGIPGVMIQQARGRIYSIPASLAATVGYVAEISQEQLKSLASQGMRAGDLVGQQGLEALYQKELAGKPGFRIAIVDNKNALVAVVAEAEAVPGQDVLTSLDLALCFKLEHSLGNQGVAVVLDHKSGQVLGLASLPGFDSNWFSLGITASQFQQVVENHALNNKAFAVFPPGSTFKTFTAIMGLDMGVLDPLYAWDTPRQWQPGPHWGNYFVRRVFRQPGPVNLELALKESDNVYFGELSLRIGQESFRDYCQVLGFERELGLPLARAKSQIGEIDCEIALADSSYGQGKMQVSPLHLAMMYGALARGDGLIPKPTLLAEGEFIEWGNTGFDLTALVTVDRILAKIAGEPGSVGYLPLPGYRGKTGTAEISQSRQLVWYVCYNQEHVLVVMLEGDSSLRSSQAVAVARAILKQGSD
jgi:penicillin-binding protein